MSIQNTDSREWHDDAELFELMRRDLFTAVVGDIMDELGYCHQFLPADVQPLRDDMVVVGRAMPVLEADVFNRSDEPFGLMFQALDDLKPHEVYLAAGGSPRYAMWGELMSIAARQRGAAGAVLNGLVRDTKGILALDFPAFAKGRYAQDQKFRGKVIDYRVRVEVNGVSVNPGDIVFGDIDGVLIVPREVERDVIVKSLEKVRGENQVREALKGGMGAEAAFREFGIM